MRLFGVRADGFHEYGEHVFSEEHQEAAIQSWMEHNPQAITDDGGLLIIGREVTTDLGASIDLLGVDRVGNVAVVELKRGQTPRETLAQALEYTAFVSTLGSDALGSLYRGYSGDDGITLASAHREFFDLSDEDTVAFNTEQRIVLVATDVAPAVHASAEYLNRRGLRVTCLEFGYFRTSTGEELLSTDIVVDGRPPAASRTTSGTGPRTDRAAFLDACDDTGRAVYEAILAMGERLALTNNWGTRGFSLRLKTNDGTEHTLCYGFPVPQRPAQARQSLSVAFAELERDLPAVRIVLEEVRAKMLETRLFVPSGRGSSVKWDLVRQPTPGQIDSVVALLEELCIRVEAASAGAFDGENSA